MRALRLLLPLLVMSLFVTSVHAESELEKVIRQQGTRTVSGYVQPIADLFGANMHSGFTQSAYIPKSGFVFRFSLIGMAAFVQDEQKTYSAPAPAGFDQKEFQTATVFGGKGTLITQPANDPSSPISFRGSDGVITSQIFPFAAPQLTIGAIYGTEAIIRYAPIPEISGLPKITLFGIGARHSLSQYLEDAPLDIAIGGIYNSFTVGDIITVKGFGAALQASKKLSILVLYGAVQYEKSTLTLSFDSTDPNSGRINIDLEGSNVMRGTLGAALDFSVLKLFADINFGAVTNLSGGLAFGF